MDKGFVWFALNNSKTDYIELSRKLAQSIKQVNKHNKVCIITNQPLEDDLFDVVKVLKHDDSAEQEWKLSNEYKVFGLTPFKHTIKLNKQDSTNSILETNRQANKRRSRTKAGGGGRGGAGGAGEGAGGAKAQGTTRAHDIRQLDRGPASATH